MNKELENIEYFGNYIGEEIITDYNTEWLANILKEFRRMKHECVTDVNKIKAIMNTKYYKTAINNIPYISREYGFLLSYHLGNFGTNYQCEVSKDVLIPLAHLNEEYCKSKIHSREIEICFINKNIKAIQNELRRRKKNNEIQR